MTQSVRDQLLKSLKEYRENTSYPLTVKIFDRNPKYDSLSTFKWDLRVSPDHGFIIDVGQLVDIARKIDPTIVITLAQTEESYLTLY